MVAITALLAVVGMVVLNNLLMRPVAAVIIDDTMVPTGDGNFRAEIRWSFRSTPDIVESAEVTLTESDVSHGAVSIWRDGEGGFSLENPTYRLTAADYILASAVGASLGLVMVMTIRGYGYVRGTGEPGSYPSVDVAEDRGFYWRT